MPDATSTGLISPYSLEAIDAMIRQKRATGQYVSDATTRQAYEAALEAQAQKALQEQALQERQSEFAQQMALEQKQYQDARNAAMWQGIFGAGQMGMKGADFLFSPTSMFAQGPSRWQKWFGGGNQAVPGTGMFTNKPDDWYVGSAGSPSAWGEAAPASVVNAATGGAGKGAEMAAPYAINMPGAAPISPAMITPVDYSAFGTAAGVGSTAAPVSGGSDWLSNAFDFSAGW